LVKAIAELAIQYENIIIDEVSMMSGDQLDILFMAVSDYNLRKDTALRRKFGIVLIGDFLQLSPVKAKWAFEADCWRYFRENTEKLEKIWRQDDPVFLEGINLVRAGKGHDGIEKLKEAGVVFSPGVEQAFDGTTLYSKNAEVDKHNALRLTTLSGEPWAMPSYRWGKLGAEAKNIPDKLKLKAGALVMILSNHQDFTYVNGDLGHIAKEPESSDTGIMVNIKRNGETATIGYITRNNTSNTAYDEYKREYSVDEVPQYSKWLEKVGEKWVPRRDGMNPLDPPWGEVYYDHDVKKFVIGAVKYLPLRLGWATTTHKSQGLSMDTVQLDPRGSFFGSPGMAYVALSRARTAKGLRIVGTPGIFANRVKMDDKVKEWM
jgi:ATP-dependent exoDNAse (exonuclease V) alpha subunit